MSTQRRALPPLLSLLYYIYNLLGHKSATIFLHALHWKEGVVISVYLQFAHMYTEQSCSLSDWTIPPPKEVKGEV